MPAARRSPTPRRTESIESYLRETRVVALIAVLVLVGGVVSDLVAGRFWERHALLAGLASSFIVVMLSVAVVNEALERRGRQRWSVLAQYAMFELTRNARAFWTGVAQLAGIMPPGARTAKALEVGSEAVADTERLTGALEEVMAESERRRSLHEGIARYLDDADELLGRWAAVMLNSGAYAEIIDRHVELASEVAWLEALFDASDPATVNTRAGINSASHPAVAIEGPVDDPTLVSRVVLVTRVAEELDRLTLKVALRVVPVDWWAQRVGVSPSIWTENTGEV